MADLFTANLLSKTAFVHGLACVRVPWLERYRPDLAQPLTPAERERMEAGTRIGRLARELYPGGVAVDSRGCDPDEAMRRTLSLMESGAERLFEATFVASDCMARVDILWKSPAGGWVIDEVKSSTVKEPEKLVNTDKAADLAFQVFVLKKAGLEVQGARLVLVDSSYVWEGGAFAAESMLGTVDLTLHCIELQPDIERRIAVLHQVLASPTEPIVAINTHCKTCGFNPHCLCNRPADDVLILPGVRATTIDELHARGCVSISQIDDDFKLTAKQRRLREVFRSARPHLGDGLAASLGEIRFPAAFVDYETSATAHPLFPGTRPYQAICFQWSAHVMESPDTDPVHYEFLSEDDCDPRPAFCESLYSLTRDCSSIVHYTGFEIHQLRPMADAGIAYAKEMLHVIRERTFDLHKVVDEHVCLQEFRGRTTIKLVLPALVPGMSYKDMLVADGNAAGTAFREMIHPQTAPARKAELRAALLRYCEQDTLAMVEIYRALRRLADAL